MADIKSRLKNLMSKAMDKFEGNGQSYTLNDINKRIGEFKNILNLNSNQKKENKAENEFNIDISIENFKRERNSPIKKSKERNSDKSHQFQLLDNKFWNTKTRRNNIPRPENSIIQMKNKKNGLINLNKIEFSKPSSTETKELLTNNISDLYKHKSKEKINNLKRLNLKEINLGHNSKRNNLVNNPDLNTNSNSFLNKYRNHSSNQSAKSYILSPKNSNNFNNDSSMRVRREIDQFSKSLTNGTKKNSSSLINRPPVNINSELDINYRSYLELSPTNTKKNILVSANIFRNYSSNQKNEKNTMNRQFIRDKYSDILNIIPNTKSTNKLNMNNYLNSNDSKKCIKNSHLNVKNPSVQDPFKLSLNPVPHNNESNFFNDMKSLHSFLNNNMNMVSNDSMEEFCREFNQVPSTKKMKSSVK